MTLDTNSTVWNFNSWGRPFRIVSPSLDCSSPKTTPAQIECGSEFCTVLMESGDVYAWWPFRGILENRYREGIMELDRDETTKAVVSDDGTVIPCHTWEIDEDPAKLPMLPDLPELPGTGLPEEECRKETKLIKIAALYCHLVGLTNKGHVLKLDGPYLKGSTGTWHYVRKNAQKILYLYSNCDTQLPNYSEIDRVRMSPVFRTAAGSNGKERPSEVELSSDTMLITHVSCIISIGSELRI